MEKEIDVKTELLAILDYYHEQVLNDRCTMSAMLSFYRIIMENMDVLGTVEDFAEFYGVSEHSVRNEINRKMVQKPRRRVFYPFHPFTKIVPRKWLCKR